MESEERTKIRSQLKPCPFCGSIPYIQDAYDLTEYCPCYEEYVIFCNKRSCPAEIKVHIKFKPLEYVVAVWNNAMKNSVVENEQNVHIIEAQARKEFAQTIQKTIQKHVLDIWGRKLVQIDLLEGLINGKTS